jgi:hypothetical protein
LSTQLRCDVVKSGGCGTHRGLHHRRRDPHDRKEYVTGVSSVRFGSRPSRPWRGPASNKRRHAGWAWR